MNMDNIQAQVNKLSLLVRLETIEFLAKEDRIKYGAAPLTDEEMTLFKSMANKLPCTTRRFRDLFEDVHWMQQERNMYPHPANIGEMEWCLKYRHIGMFQRCEHSWLPYKEDADLRRLPAFRELSKIYSNLLANGKKILPPVEMDKIENEANKIINGLALELTKEK